MPLLFLYGTLKRGGSNHHFVRAQRFAGEARTAARYRLYRLEDYPGLVQAEPGETARAIRGEIWEVDEACLAELDDLEGLQEGLYRREEVTLDPPRREPVQTYVYARSVSGRADAGEEWPV